MWTTTPPFKTPERGVERRGVGVGYALCRSCWRAAISDQDDAGAWIRESFPDLFFTVSPGGYGAGTWTGIHTLIEGADNRTISNAWLRDATQPGHGPLGSLYSDVSYGMEGDTPARHRSARGAFRRPRHRQGRSAAQPIPPRDRHDHALSPGGRARSGGAVSGARGVHDLYLVFRGGDAPSPVDMDCWRFDR